MKGHLQRRGARSWRLKYDTGGDGIDGRRTHYVTLRGTKSEAQKAAAKVLAAVASAFTLTPPPKRCAILWNAGYATGPTTTSPTKPGPATRNYSANFCAASSARCRYRSFSPPTYKRSTQRWLATASPHVHG